MGKLLIYMGDILDQINRRGRLTFRSSLSLSVYRVNGQVEHLGVVSRKTVTDAYAKLLIDVMQATDSAFSDFKYHDFGTGTSESLSTDVGLGTPTGEAREVGTQIEGATADIYKTAATHNFAGTFTISEHGIFNSASGITLLDRSLLSSTIPVVPGDRIKSTYELTAVSGG